MDFKNIVESMLKENNKSKAYLADKMGISPQAISMMMKRGNATIDTLCKVCEILDYEVTIQPNRTRGARPNGQMVLEKTAEESKP